MTETVPANLAPAAGSEPRCSEQHNNRARHSAGLDRFLLRWRAHSDGVGLSLTFLETKKVGGGGELDDPRRISWQLCVQVPIPPIRV